MLYIKNTLIDKFTSLQNDFNNAYEIYKKGNDNEFDKIIEKLKIKFTLFENTINNEMKEIELILNDKIILKNETIKDSVKKSKTNNISENYGCYVHLHKDKFNETRIKCSEKTQYDVRYYHDLYEKCKKDDKKDYNAYDDAAIYMLNARGTKPTKSNKEVYRNKIKKCKEIYELYGDDLDLVYFKIHQMAKIRDKKNWESWKLYLKNKIDEKKNEESKKSLNKN